jgi:2-C-methyl-D-erythritol 2,4-cyclodiphosphate synthase
LRIGFGYDVHKLVYGRPLVIGGVTIPFEKGLDGHSDADVLAHAIMDSLLGAAGKGDIGVYFPPSDPGFKDISSLILLKEVHAVIEKSGWRVGNIDSVIVAQAPKFSPYIPRMKSTVAGVLQTEEDLINIKATTTEGLGFTGHGEGIAAYAVALLNKVKSCHP